MCPSAQAETTPSSPGNIYDALHERLCVHVLLPGVGAVDVPLSVHLSSGLSTKVRGRVPKHFAVLGCAVRACALEKFAYYSERLRVYVMERV